MRTLHRRVATEAATASALPPTFKIFERLQVQIRHSEVTVVAGQPGAGKSSLALMIALRAKTPTLYVCADTSLWTMRVRALCAVTGLEFNSAESRAIADPEWANGLLTDYAGHITWMPDPGPSVRDILEEAKAYCEVVGIMPGLVVVDNLSDIEIDEEGEWGSLRKGMRDLKKMARNLEAAVVVTHHITGSAKYDVCPSLSDVEGKPNKLPAVILTVHTSHEDGSMSVCPVKNRTGQADPTGTRAERLYFDAARMDLRDYADPVSTNPWVTGGVS